MKFIKNTSKIIHCRQYKKFDKDKLREELKQKLNGSIYNYGSSESIFFVVLNKHAPLKKKYIRSNDFLYVTKALRKAVMRCFLLESKCLKTKTQKNFEVLKNKITFAVSCTKKKEKLTK